RHDVHERNRRVIFEYAVRGRVATNDLREYVVRFVTHGTPAVWKTLLHCGVACRAARVRLGQNAAGIVCRPDFWIAPSPWRVRPTPIRFTCRAATIRTARGRSCCS